MIVALDEKLTHLQDILRKLRSVAVAFSAGVDSTFILKAAIDTLGVENVVAVTGRSDSLARSEFEQTKQLALLLSVEHVVLDTNEFENADYVSNPTNRCYHCKTTLYDHMADFIAGRGIGAIVNGINADDLGDYRPGIEAAREHKVSAPAAEAHFTKEDIRILSQAWGLPTHDKPASPCLSSRVQYGEAITPQKLRTIEDAEAVLHELGIQECRVRHHDNLARIEVPAAWITKLAQPDIAAELTRQFQALGYQYVTLDLKGFRSGSMNEVITIGGLRSH